MKRPSVKKHLMKSIGRSMVRIRQTTGPELQQAGALLRAGEVVAFPTETVYGLGADTFNESAIKKVYQLKGRPSDNPLIAHVLDEKAAKKLCVGWDERCEKLAQAFWPGPLTMVVKKAQEVPDLATAGLMTIAIRVPSHPDARSLLEEFGSPISAPSANRSGHISPTTAAHVASDFANAEDLLILDGRASEVGIESTVIDLTGEKPRVLRPGSITLGMIEGVIGKVEDSDASSQGVSPGMTLSHYAPQTPTELVPGAKLVERLKMLTEPAIVLSQNEKTFQPPHRRIEMPGTPDAYARRLYSALREADTSGCKRILIECPDETGGLWRAIHDRLHRACGGKNP